jgi:hypothetical protein
MPYIPAAQVYKPVQNYPEAHFAVFCLKAFGEAERHNLKLFEAFRPSF